jgi:hypothetical protein
MCDSGGSDPSGAGENARETARQIAEQIAPLIRRARASKFDFLAYLLAMALNEARRFSHE